MVPEVAWNFYIGGYQPAQKWLKDRKGRELSFEDILHYQKIIVALKRTDEIMKEIDGVWKVWRCFFFLVDKNRYLEKATHNLRQQ